MPRNLSPLAKRRLVLVVRWTLAIGLLAAVAWILADRLPALQAGDLAPRYSWIAASIVVLVVHYVFAAMIWHGLTIANATAIPLRDAVVAWHLSMLGKYIPGKVLVFAGRIYLYKKAGHSPARIGLVTTLELAMQILAALIVIVTCLASSRFGPLAPYRPALWVLTAVLALASNPRIIELVINTAARLLRRSPVTVSMTTLQSASLVVGLALNGLLLGTAFFLLLCGLSPIDLAELPYVAGTFLLAGIVGFLSLLTPAGLGVREGILVVGLSPIVPTGVAAMVALAARLWISVVELGMGAVYILIARRRTSESSNS